MLKKVALFALALAVVGTAVPAQAQTVEELQAQIAALLSQIQALQTQLTSGTTGGSTTVYTYNNNLTVGSEGADVSALQQFLYSKGFLTVNPTGYFGPLTKAALASYQASVGISPAVGYFGPVTRAHFNAMVATTPTPTTTPTTTPTATPTPGLSGNEGILTVELNPSPAAGTKVYEGDTDASVMGIKVKAQNSDLRVERLKVKIGSAITAYTKQMTALGLYDGSSLIAKKDLNSSTVIKEGSEYFVYFTDISFVVPMDTTKVLTVKADFYSTIESGYTGSTTLSVPSNGVRAMDAAGVNQYGPSTAISLSRSFSIESDLADSASLTISKSANSPDSTAIVSNSQGDVNEATIFALDLKADDDMAKVDRIVMNFGGLATETTAYLYDGSTLLASAEVSSNVATFSDMEDILHVAKNTTKTLTLKVSYSGAAAAAATSTVSSVPTSSIVSYNSEGGTTTTISGSASSDVMYISSVAPIFSLTSKSVSWTAGTDVASGTLTGSFNFSVKADGGDVYIPKTSAFDVVVASSSATTTSNVSVSYQEPTGVTSMTNTYKITDGSTVNFAVNFAIGEANIGAAAYYHFYLGNVNWDDADDVVAGSATYDSAYLSDTFKTSDVYVNK